MKPKHVHAFQHVPFEGPALIGDWARERGYRMSGTPLYLGGTLPDLSDVDLLVVMGGPMGVHDTEQFRWMREEKRILREAILSGTRILGVCLGAQLMADVLGARVYRGPTREIGWFPIHRTEEGGRLPLGGAFPVALDVFHWHGDTFELPEKAVLLASSQAYENQAFLYNGTALGLQFHLEMERTQIENLVENCRGELTKGPFIQAERDLLSQSFKAEGTRPVLYDLLDRFLA